MTLVDIKNALFSYFLTETTFNIKEDASSILLDTKDVDKEFVEHKEALLTAALMDLVRIGVLIEVVPGGGLYMLTQPISTFSQAVNLNPIASEMVADLVNLYVDDEGYKANKMALTSEDIITLCQFCHFLLDESSSEES